MYNRLAYVEAGLEDEAMSAPPQHPKIYHITHVDNLSAIIAAGGLRSEAEVNKDGGPAETIGMSHIKQRRLKEIRLEECYPDTFVGDYVPFYFCPRSVMLYMIYKGNAELAYKGGQQSIVHLEADLHKVVGWAERHRRKWAFSLSNAGAYGVEFRNELGKLNEIDWPSVAATSWASVRYFKQAEFLLHTAFPWELVDRIGVFDNATAQKVGRATAKADHHPQIEITRQWYY